MVQQLSIIIIIKEGTNTLQGKAQLISQLIYEGQNITIFNDGAMIMKLLDVMHPAACMG
jgi:chaperonin GroEL (HSP60 family)